MEQGRSYCEKTIFYFVNYEKQDNETPQPFDIGTTLDCLEVE
jgi:hypothetical protein